MCVYQLIQSDSSTQPHHLQFTACSLAAAGVSVRYYRRSVTLCLSAAKDCSAAFIRLCEARQPVKFANVKPLVHPANRLAIVVAEQKFALEFPQSVAQTHMIPPRKRNLVATLHVLTRWVYVEQRFRFVVMLEHHPEVFVFE